MMPAASAVVDHERPESDARVRGPIPERVDVAVIGCGLGGLTAAVHLARQGKRVACFDSHYIAGGCATQFARRTRGASYRFDIGVHYIGDCAPGGAIDSMLAEMGISQDFVPLDPDGFDVLDFPDFRFRIPVSVELYRERLLELFPSERRGIDRYLSLMRQLHTVGAKVDANDGRLNLQLAYAVLRRGRLLPLYQGRTIAAFLDTCTRDPRLRAVLLGQNGDYGLPPSEAAALAHIGLADHYFRGAYYPKGGGQIISDKIAAVVESSGGSLHLRCGIARILVENGRAAGLLTEPRHGETHEVRADVVISNADLKRTFLELIEPAHLPSGFLRRVRDYRMGGAFFITCLGLRTNLREKGLGAFNIWQYDDYDMEGFYQSYRRGPLAPRGCYITSASLKDPATHTHASPGLSTLEVMTLVPGAGESWGVSSRGVRTWDYKRSTRYHEFKQHVEDDLVARLERLCPGTREAIVYRESASPLSQTRFTRASDGSGYGLALSPGQFLGRRPDFRGPIPGLYLCGASTRANHGVLGAINSGRKVAQAIAADYR